MLTHLLMSIWDNFTASPTAVWGIGMLTHKTFWVATVTPATWGTPKDGPLISPNYATSTHPHWTRFMHYSFHPVHVRADPRASSEDNCFVIHQGTHLSPPYSREGSQVQVYGPVHHITIDGSMVPEHSDEY